MCCSAGVLDEKAASTSALGAYAEACPAAMAPYTEPVLQTLVGMSNYWHGEVRAVAYESMGKLLLAINKVGIGHVSKTARTFKASIEGY